MPETAQSPPTERFFCPHCHVSWPTVFGRGAHVPRCLLNPDRKVWNRYGTPAAQPKRKRKRKPIRRRKSAIKRPYQVNMGNEAWQALSDVDPSPVTLRNYGKPQGRELDTWESRILTLLCKQGKYDSSVSLAADLYDTSVEAQEYRVLEWNLVELILADLNEMGLVKYRLRSDTVAPGGFVIGGEMIIRISPTNFAYEWAVDVLGLDFPWRVTVGAGHHHLRERPRHEGDMTDFRSFSYRATAVGPVTKEDFIEHCAACDHFNKHRRQLVELFGTDEL